MLSFASKKCTPPLFYFFICIIVLGVYSSGWVSTGPVGVLVSTMGNAFDLGRLLVQDMNDGTLNCKELKPGFAEAEKILDEKGNVLASLYTYYIFYSNLYSVVHI